MFVRDYPNKNRGLLGNIKWLAFCYIIRYRSQNSFDEVGGEGGIVRICPQADSDMWAKGWDGSPVHLLKN